MLTRKENQWQWFQKNKSDILTLKIVDGINIFISGACVLSIEHRRNFISLCPSTVCARLYVKGLGFNVEKNNEYHNPQVHFREMSDVR